MMLSPISKAFLHRFPDHPLAKEAWLNIALAHKKAFPAGSGGAGLQIRHRSLCRARSQDQCRLAADGIPFGSAGKSQAEAERTYAKVPAGSPEYPEAIYRQALLSEQRKNVPQSRKLLEQLRTLPEKKMNRSSVAAAIRAKRNSMKRARRRSCAQTPKRCIIKICSLRRAIPGGG